MKIYLAGPLFTFAEQKFNSELRDYLEELGYEVYLPQEECKDPSSHEIFMKCVHGVTISDAVLAVLDGADADSGTCWEVGYAYATGKPVIGLRTDFRGSGDDGGFNLMLSHSCKCIIKGNHFEDELADQLRMLENSLQVK